VADIGDFEHAHSTRGILDRRRKRLDHLLERDQAQPAGDLVRSSASASVRASMYAFMTGAGCATLT
jgi:hypothetical protein